LVLLEGRGDPRLLYRRDVNATLRIRPLDRDLAEAGSASVGLVVAPEPPSAPAATASAPVALRPPLWGEVSRPAYVPRGPGRHARTRRDYQLGGSSGTTPLLGGPPGPPLAPLSLFTWDGSAQLGTPRPVSPAIWSGLGRSLGELPSILNNGVDHTPYHGVEPYLGAATQQGCCDLVPPSGGTGQRAPVPSWYIRDAPPSFDGGVRHRHSGHQHGRGRVVTACSTTIRGVTSGGGETAVQAAPATPAMGLEVQEVGPIETPRHEDTVYLPATTVPPTVVALRPERAETAARARFPDCKLIRAVTKQCR